MASEENNQHNDVVAIELPAPAGWSKKFTPKKSGTPQRNDIVFVSPTGEEIKSKRQLEQYLKSHPGGPSASEFDWGTGDTPRRSARLSEKMKAVDEPTSQSPKKKQKRSGAKGAREKKDADADEEETGAGEKDDAPAEEAKETDLEASTVDTKNAEDEEVVPEKKGDAEEPAAAAPVDAEKKADVEESKETPSVVPDVQMEESKEAPSVVPDDAQVEESKETTPSVVPDDAQVEESKETTPSVVPDPKADESKEAAPEAENGGEGKEATSDGKEAPTAAAVEEPLLQEPTKTGS